MYPLIISFEIISTIGKMVINDNIATIHAKALFFAARILPVLIISVILNYEKRLIINLPAALINAVIMNSNKPMAISELSFSPSASPN